MQDMPGSTDIPGGTSITGSQVHRGLGRVSVLPGYMSLSVFDMQGTMSRKGQMLQLHRTHTHLLHNAIAKASSRKRVPKTRNFVNRKSSRAGGCAPQRPPMFGATCAMELIPRKQHCKLLDNASGPRDGLPGSV